MVAHLVRLRFLILWNGLRRSTWQFVASILGALYGLGLLLLVVVGLVGLSFVPIDLARTLIVIGGSATVLGWVLLPLVATGIDQTVEPSRLGIFPIPLNTLLVALTVSGVLGIAGIVTSIAALATALAWWQYPLAALAAIVCAAIGVLTCVVGSRAVIALSTRIGTGRRFREAKTLIILVPLILLGPLIVGLTEAIERLDDFLPDLALILGFTPVGAIWAVPADIAAGNLGRAGIEFLIAIATLAVLFALWRPALRHALENPTASAPTKAGKDSLGAFARFPATPTGAVAARTLIYWMRDPRYAQSLITVPLIPVLLFFYSSTTDSPALLNATGPIVALLLALSIYADISYDNTAFALHLQTGVRGTADRLGRVIALAIFAVPLTVALTVGTVWFSNTWSALAGLLGISFGLLLSGFAVSSVISGRFALAVPLPGESPFKSRPGGNMTLMLTSFATWGILTLLVLPETILAVIGFITGDAIWGWASLLVGLALGAGLLVVGVRWGGAILDRRGPDLLAQLQAQK
ncbi:ABC-2 type transport system permease protein [Glaciihabitans tibetensis]|uniref:ABC-2 type transport system permease protein n=1 Tax=Glaciihabitans tibetensis TaxID=1266600 RepID=A0A2T0VKG2_9MICO|nr:transporter [Glaciihabitans tibetensis]PRY70615.1 ABC-2 type transport system permease protein [Glaciihabitans tibetensis]